MKEKVNDFGIVYIFKNEWMPGVYKIGMTRAGIQDRIASLRSTSLPSDFECLKSYESEYAIQLEKYIHRKLKGIRCNSNREFFTFHNDQIAAKTVADIVSSFIPRDYTEKEQKKAKSDFIAIGQTPSQQAKAAGLKNLLQVCELTGQSAQTLINWHRDKPELFRIVIAGCKAIIDGA